MRQEKDLFVKTSAPSSGEFYSTFKRCCELGARNILYVGLTGKLSGAINAANSAARMLCEETNIPQIKIFDSGLATIAEGFLAIEAARLANQGADLDQILKHLAGERQRVGFAAGLETLEYLARSGRISKALYLFGNATKILPIVSLNDDGKVVLVSRAIGYLQVLKEIVHYVSHEVAGFHKLSLAVMHADAIRWAETLKEMAVEQIHPDDIMITDFTPVMVAHSGPGMIGLAYHWRP
jgi:DegV family protein with EDD domain